MATYLQHLLRIQGTFTGEGNFAENTHSIEYTLDVTFTEGTDAGEVNRIYPNAATAGTSEEVVQFTAFGADDIGYGGSFAVDPAGNFLSLGIADDEIASILISNGSSTSDLDLEYNTSGGLAGLYASIANGLGYNVGASGFIVIATQQDPGMSFTQDSYRIVADEDDTSYSIILGGRSS